MRAGAKSLAPVTKMFYGDMSGGFEDPAGNAWYVATHVEDVSPEEIERRSQAMAK
jgi:PhnB protein